MLFVTIGLDLDQLACIVGVIKGQIFSNRISQQDKGFLRKCLRFSIGVNGSSIKFLFVSLDNCFCFAVSSLQQAG